MISSCSVEEFAAYLSYVRKLAFEEAPDYDYLRGLFTKLLARMNEVEDNVFDWMLIENKGGERVSILNVSMSEII